MTYLKKVVNILLNENSFNKEMRFVLSKVRQVIDEKNIIEVAIEVFSQNSFDKTLISDIAKQAGISVGSIYNYFKNKNDLYEACSVWINDQMVELVSKLVSSGRSKEQILLPVLDFLKERPAYAKISLIEDFHYIINHPNTRILKDKEQTEKMMANIVFQRYNMDHLPIKNKELLISLIVGGVQKMILSWLFFNEFGNIKDIEALVDDLKDILDYLYK